MPTEMENPLHKLTDEQIEAIGKEFDDLHDEVFDSLGERDAAYIRGMIALHRRLVLIARVELLAARYKPMWVLGTATLGAAKILENMEIGHNVMHGQWDWMNDPVINSTSWDWDTASTKEAWKHSHNYIHHTYTNVLGLDKDLGYEVMRIDPEQKWHPRYLGQPILNLFLMAFFEWGVAVHDMDIEAIRAGEKKWADVKDDLKGMAGKAKAQVIKDYIAFPALSAGVTTAAELGVRKLVESRRPRSQKLADKLPGKLRRKPAPATPAEIAIDTFRKTFWADFTANIIRNVWSNAIIFCGHFPDQAYVFNKEDYENESRGARYVRQLLGAVNIDGGPMFHVASGNLSYQVEHHLYPDMPSTRYGEIAPKVREICERYELPYNTGPFLQQWGMVQRTILRLAFPGGKPRPKPGPYKGEKIRDEGERRDRVAA
ncbi:MAG TPA: acyl-CoA desaturase [Thermoleophilaceae bacterium]|nr:acyl-CoA desaturase [Thermoleophilaceae bacterium]